MMTDGEINIDTLSHQPPPPPYCYLYIDTNALIVRNNYTSRFFRMEDDSIKFGNELTITKQGFSLHTDSLSYSTLLDKNHNNITLKDIYSKQKIYHSCHTRSSVLLATHRFSRELLIVKVIPIRNRDCYYQDKYETYSNELLVLHFSQHPNIVHLHNACFLNQKMFLIMEYMNMKDLYSIWENKCRNEMKKDGSGDIENNDQQNNKRKEYYLAIMMKQILLGLNYLHNTIQVIHCDLKPSNILINQKGQVKISDFGSCCWISKIHHQQQNNPLCGTLYYSAPEVVEDHYYNPQSDIWSLGIMLYKLLKPSIDIYTILRPKLQKNTQHQQTPQSSKSIFDYSMDYWSIVNLISNFSSLNVEPLQDSVSKECIDFLNCMLRKDRNERFLSEELLQHPFITQHCHAKDIGYDQLHLALWLSAKPQEKEKTILSKRKR